MSTQSQPARCGNDPRAQITDGDRAAIDEFRAYVADRKTEQPAAPLDLDAIQARCDAATPGPWWADDTDIIVGTPDDLQPHPVWIGETANPGTPNGGLANASFIAAARTTVPALLARVRDLEAENATLRERLDAADHGLDRWHEAFTGLQAENGRLTAELAELKMTPRERANVRVRDLLAAGDHEGATAYAEAFEASEAYDATHPRL